VCPVNMAFVMFKWGQSVGAKNVFLLPDGKRRLTTARWGCWWRSRTWAFGSGVPGAIRWVVNDGTIEKVFAEAGRR